MQQMMCCSDPLIVALYLKFCDFSVPCHMYLFLHESGLPVLSSRIPIKNIDMRQPRRILQKSKEKISHVPHSDWLTYLAEKMKCVSTSNNLIAGTTEHLLFYTPVIDSLPGAAPASFLTRPVVASSASSAPNLTPSLSAEELSASPHFQQISLRRSRSILSLQLQAHNHGYRYTAYPGQRRHAGPS